MPADAVTTPGGLLLPLAVLVPFLGMIAGLVLGGRNAQRVAMVTIVAGVAIALGIAQSMLQSGDTLVYVLGGFAPPLGIALRADGLSVVMMVAVAVVIGGIGVYARGDFGTPDGVHEARAPLMYWLLLLAVWGSLNLVFTSGDLFTLYVALELLTFAGVPLVCLDGKGETLRSALRYLLFALAGSIFYLLGAVLVYGEWGTLDVALLAQRVQLAGARIAGPSGHPLQHLGVVGGGVGRGRHEGRQAQGQQELRAAEHGGNRSRGGSAAGRSARRCRFQAVSTLSGAARCGAVDVGGASCGAGCGKPG